MDNYILKEIITSDGTYKWDYKSLANLPEARELVEGPGVTVTHETSSDTVSLSPEVSEKLEKLYDAVFPVTISLTGSEGFGDHEEGTRVTPRIEWSLSELRPGTYGIIASSSADNQTWTKVTEMNLDSPVGSYGFPATMTDRYYRLEFKSGSSKSTLGPLMVNFGRYRYMGALSEVPVEVTEDLIKSLPMKEISSDSSLSEMTLEKGHYFLFAVPGVHSPVVKELGTGGIVEAETGTVEVYRENQTSQYSSTYTWVLVPASGIDWKFQVL